jgi:hypothetical protein
MKEKIIARIKAKFPDVNLSAKRLDAIADKLSPKVTDENEIDAQLDALNDVISFSDLAKSDDKIRDLQAKLKEPKKSETEAAQSSSTTQNDEPPLWAKPLIESNQKLTQELAALQREKLEQTMQQRVTTHEKLKGISPVFYKGRKLPEKEDELEAFVDGIKADYDAFTQETNNQALLNGHTPPAAGGGTGGQKKLSPEFEEAMKQKKQEAEANKKP